MLRAGHLLQWLATALLGFIASVTTASAQLLDPPSFANPDSQPEISLLTIGPGDIFFERFGHNAIVVRDPTGGDALLYNYGIFDLSQQDFLLNFARGRMRYRMAVDELDDDVQMYRDEGRSITEQHLNLLPMQASALVEFLEWNARPENAQYRYDYFEANCSTRVRDALDKALGGALHAQSEGRSRGYTYRLDALRLMAPAPLLMLGIDLGLGPYADQRIDYWQESFEPETLSTLLPLVTMKDADGKDMPLVRPTVTIAVGQVEEPPALPPDLRWEFLVLGLVLGVAIVLLGRSQRATARIPLALFATLFELFCGLGGCVLLFLWLATDHKAAWRNENLLLLSPLCLLLIPAWIGAFRANARARNATRWIAWSVAVIAGIALFSKILPWFVQSNVQWIVLFLPIHVALAMGLQARPRTPLRAR